MITLELPFFDEPVVVPEGAVLDFPDGLYGYPESRRWALVDPVCERRGNVAILQSIDSADLRFVAANLSAGCPTIAAFMVRMLGAEVLVALGASRSAPPVVLCIVNTAHGALVCNLSAPLFLGLERATGRQVIQPRSPFGMREPFASLGSIERALGGEA